MLKGRVIGNKHEMKVTSEWLEVEKITSNKFSERIDFKNGKFIIIEQGIIKYHCL